MNIAFFHSNGIIPTLGGISRTTYNLLKLFRENGHTVWLIGEKNVQLDYAYDHQQIFLNGAEIDSPENKCFLCGFFAENNIDIVINQNPFVRKYVDLLGYCKKEIGIKVVSCYHNSILTPIYLYAYQREYLLKKKDRKWLFSLLKNKIVNKIIIWLYIHKYRKCFRETIENSDAVVLLCEGQIEEFKRMSGISDLSNVYVIPNYMPSVSHEKHIKLKQVLWVGTFDYTIKRPDYMLKIWSKIEPNYPDWTLYMLGDGPSLKEMKSLAENLSLKHVVFTGRVNPEKYYQRADIQCITSIHEAFPMVSIEAMAHYMPVVAFDSFTSASYIINNEVDGLLVDYFDIEKYCKAVETLIVNVNRRSQMGKNAYNDSTRFSKEVVYSLWEKMMNSL